MGGSEGALRPPRTGLSVLNREILSYYEFHMGWGGVGWGGPIPRKVNMTAAGAVDREFFYI